MKNSAVTTHKYPPRALALAIAATISGLTPAVCSAERIIEEVIVTAEHREASLQDTQISITALTEKDIAERGISNVQDLSSYTPNVRIAPLANGRAGVSISMRGVRQGESQVSFDPAVGMYLDNALIAKGTGALLDVAEIERIEVLRGPQGTLYGRNTIGGAINIITKKPANEFEASLKTTVGKFGQQDVRGMVNVPIFSGGDAGDLAARVSLASIQRDALYDNDFVGGEVSETGEKDRTAAIVHLQWTPSDAMKILYSYDRSRIDEKPTPVFLTFTPSGSTGITEDKHPDSGNWDGPFQSELEVDGHALNISLDLTDSMTIHSITSQRDMWNYAITESDGGPSPSLVTDDEQEDQTFTQEFRLVGQALDSTLSYSTGVYYLDEDGKMDTNVILFGGLATIPTVVDFANEAWAVYGQATYDLTDRLHVTFGGRYTEEKREMTKENVGDAEGDFENFSPMVSLSIDWTDDIMSYFKIADGYNSGGFNSRLNDPVLFDKGFDSETMRAYELGFKSTFAERVRFNLAVWYSDYDDKQVSQLVGPSTNLLTNAGKVTIWGAESEITAQVTDALELGWSHGYQEPEYDEWDDPTLGDLTNSPFAYAPRNSGDAFAIYEIPFIGQSLLSARLEYSYRDEIEFLSKENQINGSGALELWNARVTWSEIQGPGDSMMRVSAWVKNLKDESYWNFGVDQLGPLGVAFNSYGDPRTYGLDFAIDF